MSDVNNDDVRKFAEKYGYYMPDKPVDKSQGLGTRDDGPDIGDIFQEFVVSQLR